MYIEFAECAVTLKQSAVWGWGEDGLSGNGRKGHASEAKRAMVSSLVTNGAMGCGL